MSINRNLVLGFIVFGGLGTAIFFLPKSAVNNKTLDTEGPKTEEKAKTEIQTADTLHTLPAGVSESLTVLKKSLASAKSTSERATLFSNIAATFSKSNRYDSAGHYYEMAANTTTDPELTYKAGSAYYEGIAFASSASKIEFLSGKARSLLETLPVSDENYTEAQAKSAMTWVNSESPMKGILKLRDLAEKNPKNEFVAYQLGLLSFQSGQYDKAVARFEKVLELNKGNVNAWFYLAQSLQQLGKIKEALAAINQGMPLAKEEDTKASFQEMKRQLSEN